jgi:hypothetical protein
MRACIGFARLNQLGVLLCTITPPLFAGGSCQDPQLPREEPPGPRRSPFVFGDVPAAAFGVDRDFARMFSDEAVQTRSREVEYRFRVDSVRGAGAIWVVIRLLSVSFL